ncbi:hypothetical protein F503_08436 [Ophiostoma piceae UAMH 11346]|uniref:Uncharacterized protein n=1 Tax=Ophiostoma piceae (strain UAMH 11346) TaxID=1262450 RepID=S3CYB5_OPHP1|nr:hypothetical protein F503_08436 [Ophiostoma piceae UAMH 11346]
MSLEDCYATIKSQPNSAYAGERLCFPGFKLKISAPSRVNIDKVVMSVYHPSIDDSPPCVLQKVNFIFDEEDRRSGKPQGLVWSHTGKLYVHLEAYQILLKRRTHREQGAAAERLSILHRRSMIHTTLRSEYTENC